MALRPSRASALVASLAAASNILLAGACAAGSPADTTGDTSATSLADINPTRVDRAAGQQATAAVIEGRFDVGGHQLYLHCAGTGSPTVVYMHGAITDSSIDPHANGIAIQDRLRGDMRVCLYDRRNVGHSDTVDEPQTPQDAMTDMRNLLAEAGVEPPYVLLGASFGGTLAYLYANNYPDEVSGMVLLDSMFPDELELEHLFPVADRYKSFVKEDECCSLERIAHYKVLREGWRYIGREPAIPVTFLASGQEPRDVNDFGIPEYDARILDLQAAFVERFSPGRLIWVDSPHFMEPAVPDDIATAVRDVAATDTGQ